MRCFRSHLPCLPLLLAVGFLGGCATTSKSSHREMPKTGWGQPPQVTSEAVMDFTSPRPAAAAIQPAGFSQAGPSELGAPTDVSDRVETVTPMDAVLLTAFSSDARYCGLEARPKSHVLFVSPSLTSFALNRPTPTDTHAAGSGKRGALRLTCASAEVANAISSTPANNPLTLLSIGLRLARGASYFTNA